MEDKKLCAAISRAERAEEALQWLFNEFDCRDDEYGVLFSRSDLDHIRKLAFSSPPADASTMSSTSEQRFIEALTPSAETKSAYMGEFLFRAHESNDVGEEFTRSFTVPWTTIKEIMKAIRKRAGIDGDHISEATGMVGGPCKAALIRCAARLLSLHELRNDPKEVQEAAWKKALANVEEARAVLNEGHITDASTMGGEREQRLADSLDEILNYSGGADNALEDEYVMERAIAALADMEQKS